ncbi:MAG: BatA domain-containing protein [Phycisphaerae bacterium]
MNPGHAQAFLESLTGLAAVTFAHPPMLGGLAAVLVPIAIHLVHRSRPQPVVFPTLRFLRASAASRSRLQRLRNPVLLCLRCAAVALLALAFARPQWFASADAATNAGRDTVAVVLLDASASMGYAETAASTMSRAVATAGAVVDSLDPGRGDRANVILAGLLPQAMFARPTANLAAVKARLEAVRTTAERADFGAAIALAAAQLAEFRPSRKELHIITDLQRTNWAEGDPTGRSGPGDPSCGRDDLAGRSGSGEASHSDVDFGVLPRDTEVVFHLAGPHGPRSNACVSDIAIEPPVPIAGEPCRISVRLANHSAAPTLRDVALRASDGRQWSKAGVRLAPGEPLSVPFDVRFDEPGVYELTAEIAPDTLAMDDRRYAVMHVNARQRVLLCTDADLRDGVTSGYLLARGLAPFPDGRGTIELQTVRSAELSAARLAGADVLFLDASEPLSADAVQAIGDYLRRGGGIAMFLGSAAARENLVALRGITAGRDSWPLEVMDVRDEAAKLLLNPARPHPLLQPLGEAGTESLQRVTVYRHFGTRAADNARGAIARFENGDVALATVSRSAGTLLVCNISPEPQWSDVAKHAVFPGLLHEMARFLRPKAAGVPPACAGVPAAVQWRADETPKDIQISGTTGEPIRVAVRRDGPTAAVTLPPAAAPGFLRIRAGEKLVESIAVNVDPRESDLAAMPVESLQKRTANRGKTALRATTDIDGMREQRHGRPLWPWAVGMGLGVLAIEMVCLLFWRR